MIDGNDRLVNRENREGIALITPVKNEEENLEELLGTVRGQTLQPRIWVFVNDNSDDRSGEIMKKASEETSWIDYIETDSSQGEYDIGANYAQVVSAGYNYIRNQLSMCPKRYMILDGDMRLPDPECISKLYNYMDEHEDIAIASAGIYIRDGGELKLEMRSDDEPAGAATIYDGLFYDKIGGPPIAPAVDSVTKAKARIEGFKCKYLSEVVSVQSRPTGSKNGIVKNAFYRGGYWYYHGQRIDIALIKSLYQAKSYPYIDSVAYFVGYMHSMLLIRDKIDDESVREYFRSEKSKRVYSKIMRYMRFWE